MPLCDNLDWWLLIETGFIEISAAQQLYVPYTKSLLLILVKQAR